MEGFNDAYRVTMAEEQVQHSIAQCFTWVNVSLSALARRSIRLTRLVKWPDAVTNMKRGHQLLYCPT